LDRRIKKELADLDVADDLDTALALATKEVEHGKVFVIAFTSLITLIYIHHSIALQVPPAEEVPSTRNCCALVDKIRRVLHATGT
jgi:hypothetical protein